MTAYLEHEAPEVARAALVRLTIAELHVLLHHDLEGLVGRPRVLHLDVSKGDGEAPLPLPHPLHDEQVAAAGVPLVPRVHHRDVLRWIYTHAM